MQQSESIDKIAPALIKAKKSFSKAKASKVNTHLKNQYANLSDVLDAVEPALNENEIMVQQYMLDTSTEKVMHLATRLLHSSGQFMEFQYNMPIEKTTAQGYGSTTSYARRYALAAILSISQTDDDAEVAKRSVDDFKLMATTKHTPEELRQVYSMAKAQLTAAEFKIIEPFLMEQSTKAKAIASEVPASGFNPNKPDQVAHPQPATTKPEQTNAQDIENF